jgi:hypothetical protein
VPTSGDESRYARNYAFFDGTWRANATTRMHSYGDPRLYKNTMLVWNLARSVVRLYAQAVYAGGLSTDGKPLPDGTGGAIPLAPETGNDAKDEALRTAIAELWSMWRWQMHMSLQPKMAAILGECLTELVDDVPRGTVEPKLVWTGFVRDLEIGGANGDVKRYALEYHVGIPASTAFGRTVTAESYTFRKEVDKDNFRYYKDGKPFDYPDIGPAVQTNPYGFVPAIWSRHELNGYDHHGIGAFEPALNATMRLNSVLAHAVDYQQKQFAAPVGIKGQGGGGSLRRQLGNLVNASRAQTADEQAAEAAAIAERLDLLPMGPDGAFVNLDFDVGRTVELVKFLEDAIVAEFPESRFGMQILEMTQLTAPGAERALGPVVGMVKAARDVHDVQTIKLHQMALAILGARLKAGNYPRELVAARPARYEKFRAYDLTSYARGDLDFSIPDRPVIPETRDDRVNWALAVGQLKDPVLMRKAGLSDEEILQMQADRRSAAEEAMRRFDAGQEPGDGGAPFGNDEEDAA